jgi:Flp pilus assembly protein TadD
MQRAEVLAAEGDYGKAISLYSRAIQFDPDSAGALVNRGIAKAMTGNIDEAIADFDRAIDISPLDDNAYCCRGSALGHIDRDRAFADFTKAIDLNPYSANAYYNRGVVHDGLGDFDAAITDCSKAIELEPCRANAYYTRGNAWREKGEWDLAIASYDQAIALNPGDQSAYYNRACARLARGNVDAALIDFGNACERQVVSAFAERDGRIFSCYTEDDPDGAEGGIVCLVHWSLRFSNGKWDMEVLGGLRHNDKVFLILAYGDAEIPEGGLEFEGRCPDIATRSTPGARPGLRYYFDIGGIICECETTRAEGTMRIAGQSYALGAGAFFLLANQPEGPRVQQLNRDLTSIRYEARHFESLLESDAEIRLFLFQAD